MDKKNLTRKDLAKKINKQMGFSKNFALKVIDNFFEILGNELIKSNKVKISSFGAFSVLNKKERIGRNPKTKIEAKIEARKVVQFKPSHLAKSRLNAK